MKISQSFEIKTNRSPQPRRCAFERTDGTQCKAHPQAGKQYCFFHNTDPAPHVTKKRTAATKAGGIAGRSKPPMASRLRTVSDVVDLISQGIHQLRRDRLDPESGAAIGLLSRVLLGAMEKDAMGKDALEGSSPTHWEAIVSHQEPVPVPVPHALLLPEAEYAAESELPDGEIPDGEIDDEPMDKKT